MPVTYSDRKDLPCRPLAELFCAVGWSDKIATGEMLGPILLTIHNITYYQRLMERARRAIEQDAYLEFYRERFAGWAAGVPE